MMSQILIWDGLGPPPKCEESCFIIFWSGRQNINQLNILSIIDFIESANNKYKNIYIDWVNRLHDNKIFETGVTPSKIKNPDLIYGVSIQLRKKVILITQNI